MIGHNLRLPKLLPVCRKELAAAELKYLLNKSIHIFWNSRHTRFLLQKKGRLCSSSIMFDKKLKD